MANLKKTSILVSILIIAGLLRFFNLMHDEPYFFNPDERNMANATTQFRLPGSFSEIPGCVLHEISPVLPKNLQGTNSSWQSDSCNLNPRFFAYGQFPLYLAFISDQILKVITFQPITNNESLITTFPAAIFWLRFYSALSSTLTVLIVFQLTKVMVKGSKLNKNVKMQISYFAALSTAFIPGLIQSAHFGTTESLLTFFFLTNVYLSIRCLNLLKTSSVTPGNILLKSSLKLIILFSLSTGLAIGSKLTGLIFLAPLAIGLTARVVQLLVGKGMEIRQKISSIIICILFGGVSLLGALAVGILSSLYNVIDSKDFYSAVFGYEKDVATGKYLAFYTTQFQETKPFVYHLQKIFPYSAGLPLTIFGLLGFCIAVLLISYQIIRFLSTKNRNRILRFSLPSIRINIDPLMLTVLAGSFLCYLVPNALLYAKWSRFMTPLLPFFSVFSTFILILTAKKIRSLMAQITVILALAASIIPGALFASVYIHDDSRVQATEWIVANIPDNSFILSETANVIDIPLYSLSPKQENPSPVRAPKNYTVISFDFYHMDENPKLQHDLFEFLVKSDYIFIPSRRIFTNFSRFPEKYPMITKYYQNLFSGRLGFDEVAHINSFPGIGPLRFDDESAEETWTVFDHPVIRIFKKTRPLLQSEYEALLK